MLKILQISNKAPFPANDGSSIAVYNMARGLLRNNVSLHLLCINTKKHFKPDEGMPSKFREATHYQSVFRNTNPSYLGAFLNLFSSRSYFVSRFVFPAFSRALSRTLRNNQFDIVQLEGLFMAPYIDVIRRNTKALIVLRAHNIEHQIWQRHMQHEPAGLRSLYIKLQNRRLKRYEIGVLKKVDAIVPISRADEKAFKQLGAKVPMYTCVTGVNPREYRPVPGEKVKPYTVFYIGSMDWLPNQEAVKWFLENCWSRICEAVPKARLVIAGRGMPLSLFHINQSNVELVENVADTRAFFRQHQIMIVPLRSGSGLRIKIVEGMAAGKPIVSTDVGAEGIRCTHRSNILLANNPNDFAASVIELLTNRQLRQQLERNATAFAATEFDNARLVSGLVSFYKKLANA